MKGDFSRFTFDPARHFTRVLMQQGRVQLDSDFNEQMDILWHYLRTVAADLIGPHGGPDGDQLGFGITTQWAGGKGNSVLTDLMIGFGRYYVDGILCENTRQSMMADNTGPVSAASMGHDSAEDEGMDEMDALEEERRRRSGMPERALNKENRVTYYTQSGYPFSVEEAKAPPYKLPDAPFLVYLDVWERSVSAIEEPGILEVALGGPDTSARTQVVWQVRARGIQGALHNETRCTDFESNTYWRNLMSELQPEKRGRLGAVAAKPRADDSTDPCIISPDARYRGAENQLYRVEIHTGGIAGSAVSPPTFKWSRDNGANVYSVLAVKEKTVFLENLGRDGRSGLQAGDWVEIVDDDYTLLGKTQPLSQVESVDAIGMSVTLKTAHPAVSPGKHPLLRRWDQRAGEQNSGGLKINDHTGVPQGDNAALIKADTLLNLEDGIQVYFEAGSTYVAGDYWLIPARTATGNIEWPRGNNPQQPPLLPPQGVRHHYAPLAAIFSAPQGGQGSPPSDPFLVVDLRRRIDPAAKCFFGIM